MENRTLPVGTSFAVRKPQPHMSRGRRLLLISGVALCLALLTGGVYWALHSPAFAVTRVETGSYRFTSPAALDSVLGTFLGRNILALNEDDVVDSMARLRWVRDLHIQRRLPGTLAVDFREWRPLAVIAQHDGAATAADLTWVLGENGRILRFPPDMEVPALPTLVGFPRGEEPVTADGKGGDPSQTASEETARLLELFQAIADVGLETVAAVDFVVVRPAGYAIVLADSQGRLQVGRKDFRLRLERYLAARSHLEPGLDVDLRFADRVTVHRPSP